MPWRPYWPTPVAGLTRRDEPRDPAAAAEAFMRRVVGDDTWDALPERTREARRAEGPALLAELDALRSLTAAPYAVEALRGRAIVGHGSRTDERHRRGTGELADLVGVVPAVIDGAGHGAHSSHPAAFAQLVRAAVALIR